MLMKKTIARWAHKFNIPSIGSQGARKYTKESRNIKQVPYSKIWTIAL